MDRLKPWDRLTMIALGCTSHGRRMSAEPSDELKRLAAVVADWADGRSSFKLYIYGSRVRNDHRLDSDVDIYMAWEQPTHEDTVWFTREQEADCRSLQPLLPGKLHLNRGNDPIKGPVLKAAANPIWVDRNVVCVWLEPNPLATSAKS